jgi:hypothetical protein
MSAISVCLIKDFFVCTDEVAHKIYDLSLSGYESGKKGEYRDGFDSDFWLKGAGHEATQLELFNNIKNNQVYNMWMWAYHVGLNEFWEASTAPTLRSRQDPIKTSMSPENVDDEAPTLMDPVSVLSSSDFVNLADYN